MLELSLKRKQILNRDLSIFGVYIDYMVEGLDVDFNKKNLSARRKVAIFSWFLKELIDRNELSARISTPGGYVFLPVAHENLSAPGIASLIKLFAKILGRQKIHLVLEIDDSFVISRSRFTGIMQRQVSEAIYTMLDNGIMFSLRFKKKTDDYTNRWIAGGVFSFLTFEYHQADMLLEPITEQAGENETIVLLRRNIMKGLTKCIVDNISERGELSRALLLPLFFFSGNYIAPEQLTDLA